jgi:8-oxo-dGTP diphosphatase
MNENRSMQEEPQKRQEQQRSARVVVAAVIERDGLILAARRTEPPELAGRWEFPGGKAEPGESDGEALERECREELGVRIVVGERIGPEYRVPSGAMVVRTYLATIDEGEPQPLESHDELAWVRPGTPEMRALAWLDGDFLILDALDARRAAAADLPPGVIRVA